MGGLKKGQNNQHPSNLINIIDQAFKAETPCRNCSIKKYVNLLCTKLKEWSKKKGFIAPVTSLQ
jgi:hypothetical protein